MITKTERRKLKKAIGREYSPGVLQILNDNGALTRFGTKYTSDYISKVLSGSRESFTVEDAIYQYAKQQIKLAAKRKEARESILNK